MSKKLRAFFQLLRVDEYYGNTFVLTILGSLLNKGHLSLISLVQVFFVSLFLTAFAFAINDIEDAADDAKDPKKVNRNPISAKRLNLFEANIFTYALAGLCLLLAWSLGSLAFVLAVFGLILGFLYSYKAVRLKSMPILDLASHGLFLGAIQLLIAATAFNSPLTPLALLAAAGVFIASVVGDLNNEIRDWEVDRKTNIRNTASIINVRVVGPYVEYLYIFPIAALILVVAQILPGQKRLGLMIATIIGAVIYALLPKKIRYNIAIKWVQPIIAFAGLFAYVIFYLWQI